MGAANVVPGVSGGTIAFITGIYERLINALKSFDVQAVKLLFGFKIREFIKHVDFWFLFVLGLGVLTSVATLAKLLEIGFEHYPVYVASLFFGLIAASIWSVAKMVKQWGMGPVIGVLIGCAVAVALAFAPEANENKNIMYLLLCGVVATCSMIIPGVSGSFVLLMMGNYQLIMISSVNNVTDRKFGEAISVLIPVGIGAVVGLIALSHFLSWLFRKFHDLAVGVITGFVAGSLVIIWPWKLADPESIIIKNGEEKVMAYVRYFPNMDAEFFIAVPIMLVGVAIMVLTEKLGATRSE